MSSIITVFGSSFPPPGSPDYESARTLGSLLARAGYTVCNGGYGGTMEASARGAKEAGGRTIGIITDYFGAVANPFIDERIATATHAERLHRLIERGEGYVVLRGSTGTLVEFATVWEYLNKRILKNKPLVVVGEFWLPVIGTLNDEFMWEGKGKATQYLTTVRTLEECVSSLDRYFRNLPGT